MMGSPATSTVPADSASERRAASQTSPVGVVWCRQVDNEAESPGYTTVPEEFPGHRETLETIRIVGNLTVNVADTHDYWDPDPSQPLSYYPNLFLYPAANGRYTCVGRMFLSTEDRPRLGMKTLVLDTQQLLASGEFGATVLRWHASMGGPKRDGARAPPQPDPALYGVIGEGFLFHRGATDPVLLVASDQWEAAMQAILDLVRVLPASLIALGAILAFPYFLPQPKTNLHEFTEQIPLSLALMRVGRGEAAGDRHAKRIQSWESASVTVRDLTDGVPAPSGRAKEVNPLILQFVRDRQEAKLVPIRQRVDLVETARLRAHLTDPERQGGRDRRKEIWRIGTAMESAALLLQRARGRHVPVTAETAKRAQEYLQARVPSGTPESPIEDAVVGPTPPAAAEAPGARHLPPWLNRPADTPAPSRTDRIEVVPVSVSDDPAMHPAAAMPPAATLRPPLPPPRPAASTPTPPPPPASAAPPAPPAPPESPPAAVPIASPPPPLHAPSAPTTPEMERLIQERVGQARAQIAEDVRRSTADLEQRLTARWTESAGRRGESDDSFRVGLEGRLSEAQGAQQTAIEAFRIELDKRLEASEVRFRAALAVATGAEVDQRIQATETRLRSTLPNDLVPEVDQRVQASETRLRSAIASEVGPAVDERIQASEGKLRAEFATELGPAVDERIQASEAKLRAAFSSEIAPTVEQRVQESEARVRASITNELGPEVDKRLDASEARVRAAFSDLLGPEVDRRVGASLDPKVAEALGRIRDDQRGVAEAHRQRVADEADRTNAELRERFGRAEEELRASLSAQLDLHLREAADRELSIRDELEGRLRESIQKRLDELDAKRLREQKEADQRLTILVDGRTRELSERLAKSSTDSHGRLSGTVEDRVAQAEGRISTKFETRASELQAANLQAIADLQVRMQGHFDERLREGLDREREKVLELLARLKGEVEGSFARASDPAKLEPVLRDRLARTIDAFRVETQRMVDTRVGEAETRLSELPVEGMHRLEQVEQVLAEREALLEQLETRIRGELDELDHRTQVLSDRLVPVVRKAWLKIAEMQKAPPGAGAPEADVQQLRRDLHREVRRLEADLSEKTNEIRERMETSIANQGRVWLTLIRQLSQLTDNRRALERGQGGPPEESAWSESEERDPLAGLPPAPARRPASAAPPPATYSDDDPLGPVEPQPDRRRPPRRR
ncbi:MAG: hypothetical protein L3J77_02475 [Thermoplasmata archaeon]|nr:hypothetical protein [Thermoplasmata archaeon]